MSEEMFIEEKCGFNKFQRLRFFHGMLLDDKDFTNEQQYHIEKRKLHNRMLHGWGVVCGLDIEWNKDANFFVVKPGMALDCQGNEIVVCNDVTVNLTDSTCSSSKQKSRPITPEDCEQQAQGAQNEITRYIGIRYHEKATAPVPVYIPGDECGKQDCANSKFKEGFCIDILKECPDNDGSGYGIQSNYLKCMNEIFGEYISSGKDLSNDLESLCECIEEKSQKICNEFLRCPKCCSDRHHVGLGKIVLYENNKIKELIIDECRQYVIGNIIVQNSLYGLWCFMYQILKEILKCKNQKMKKPDDTGQKKPSKTTAAKPKTAAKKKATEPS